MPMCDASQPPQGRVFKGESVFCSRNLDNGFRFDRSASQISPSAAKASDIRFVAAFESAQRGLPQTQPRRARSAEDVAELPQDAGVSVDCVSSELKEVGGELGFPGAEEDSANANPKLELELVVDGANRSRDEITDNAFRENRRRGVPEEMAQRDAGLRGQLCSDAISLPAGKTLYTALKRALAHPGKRAAGIRIAIPLLVPQAALLDLHLFRR